MLCQAGSLRLSGGRRTERCSNRRSTDASTRFLTRRLGKSGFNNVQINPILAPIGHSTSLSRIDPGSKAPDLGLVLRIQPVPGSAAQQTLSAFRSEPEVRQLEADAIPRSGVDLECFG